MILEEETFRKFGYWPSELKPQSGKPVLAACDDCGKVRLTSKHDHCALCKSCARRGNNHPNYGNHLSEETKNKIGAANKGRHPSEKARKKMSERQKGEKNYFFGKHHSNEAKQKNREGHKGKHPSEETKQKIREASKKNWQDPVFIKKVFDGWQAKPNKPEKKVGGILQKHLPNEYAYNGDFGCGITIGGKIPDFVNVNGEKIVIEVFGPWHDEVFMRDHFGKDISWKQTEFGTKAHYSQFGYKCVVFWQEELERIDAEQFILEKMKKEGAV